MPAPVSLPVRQVLWQLYQEGLSTADIAGHLQLPPRTVQNLLHRFVRQDGPQPAAYRPGTGRRRCDDIWCERVLAMRKQHPDWGAGYIRVRLGLAFPKETPPSERTLLRWLATAKAPAAPRGRLPQSERRRASLPHQVWQVDAAEQMQLANGDGVSWLRVVDEASGAFLQTVVFPPAVLGARGDPIGAAAPAGDFQRLGTARSIPGR